LVAFAQTAHTPCSNSSIQSKGETVARFIMPLHADIPTAAFVTGYLLNYIKFETAFIAWSS